MRSTANNWFAQQRKNKLLKQLLLNGGEEQLEAIPTDQERLANSGNLKRKASNYNGMGSRVSSQKIIPFENTSIATEEGKNGEIQRKKLSSSQLNNEISGTGTTVRKRKYNRLNALNPSNNIDGLSAASLSSHSFFSLNSSSFYSERPKLPKNLMLQS